MPRAAAGLPDRLVFDLDPGAGTSIVDCCRVAERLHDLLVADGLRTYPKTSGSKGMQLYAAIATDSPSPPPPTRNDSGNSWPARHPTLSLP